MAFKSGKDWNGNAGGRPKDVVSPLARAHTKEAIERLVFWMKSNNPKASVSATIALLDRGWGKPAQAMQLQDGDGGPLSFSLVNFKGSSDHNDSV